MDLIQWLSVCPFFTNTLYVTSDKEYLYFCPPPPLDGRPLHAVHHTGSDINQGSVWKFITKLAFLEENQTSLT